MRDFKRTTDQPGAMTLDEARGIVAACEEHQYFDISHSGRDPSEAACLDGWFTIEQLKALVLVMESQFADRASSTCSALTDLST